MQLFQQVSRRAKEEAENESTSKYVWSYFYCACNGNNPGKKTWVRFSPTAANRGKSPLETTDAEVLEIIDSRGWNAIERQFQYLRTRIDDSEQSQPKTFSRIQGSGAYSDRSFQGWITRASKKIFSSGVVAKNFSSWEGQKPMKSVVL